ncbi:MAG: VOC family protein [Gemmataceae bacterium]
MANLLSVTAMIPAGPSLADALRFYTELLGFAVRWQSGNMAGFRRGQVEFNLIENTNREWAENASFSIGVDDLDALYAEYRGVAANVGPLEMKRWADASFT